MEPKLEVLRSDGFVERHSVAADAVYVPAACFSRGAIVTRFFKRMPFDGELEFLLSNAYQNPIAASVWTLRLSVNGRILRRWKAAREWSNCAIIVKNLQTYDQVALQIVVNDNRLDVPSWETASRYNISGITLTASVARGSVSVDSSVRDPDFDVIGTNGVFRMTSARACAERVKEAFANEFGSRTFLFESDRCQTPIKVVRRPNANRTIVLCNGAVDLDRSMGRPVFQRSSFSGDIEANQIYICDPGSLGPGALSLSWGVMGFDDWCIPDVSETVRSIVRILNGDSAIPTTYFGSSAGGFWALALAHHDPQGRSIVNNTQFDWTRWMAGAVNDLRTARLGNELPAELRRRLPYQTSVLRLLARRPNPLAVDYYVNMASHHDVVVDLPQMESFMSSNPRQASGVSIHRYMDQAAGHNPMGMSRILTILNES